MASSPFLGEIRIMSFNFAPKGWAMCNGQLLSIQQNTALFALFGTFYGGNGTSTFALPNLQGRASAGMQGSTPGVVTGEATHTLIISEIPSHTHAMAVSTTGPLENATGRNPSGTIPAQQALIAGSPPHPGPNLGYRPGVGHLQRQHDRLHRRPTAREPAALPRTQFLRGASGNLPVAELTLEPARE